MLVAFVGNPALGCAFWTTISKDLYGAKSIALLKETKIQKKYLH